MSITKKFLWIFLPLAVIISSLFYIMMTQVASILLNTPQMPTESISIINGMSTWSSCIMFGVGLALFITLICIKKWIPLIAVMLFLSIQGVMSLPMGIIMKYKPEWMAMAMGLTLVASGVVMIWFAHILNFYNAKNIFRNNISIPLVALGAIIPLIGGVVGNILNESLNPPNLLEQQFTDMSSNAIGILSIALIGPIAEEVVFRGFVCRSLLKSGVPTGLTIVISAIIFGVIHFNPAQIMFAFIMGLFLGYIYCRTGNLVIPIIAHVVNNSISAAMMAIYGEEANNMTFEHIFGSQSTVWVVMVVCIIACIRLVLVFEKKCEAAEVLWDKMEPETKEKSNVTPPEIPQIQK